MKGILVLFIWINEIDDLVWRLWLFVLANSKFCISYSWLYSMPRNITRWCVKRRDTRFQLQDSLVAPLLISYEFDLNLVYLVSFPFPFSSSNSTFPFLHTLYSSSSPAYWCTLGFAQLCNNELLIQISYFNSLD